MTKHQIVYKRVKDLKLNARNPRKNDRAVDTVAKSIEKYGFKNPLIIDCNNTVYCGNTRLKAARKLKLEEVPCIVADDLTKEQIREYALLDNKTNEIAEWDLELLEEELKELSLDDFDLDWEIPELDDPQEIVDDNFDVDAAVKNMDEPKCKQGDVWELGDHRLMCGDSTTEDVKVLMSGGGGAKANLLITDPPYNVSYEGKTNESLTIKNDSMDPEQFREFLTAAFTRASEVMRDGAAFYVWYASRESINFETALNNAGFRVRQQLIWNKNSMVLGRQDYQWKHEPCLYGWKDGASHHWYSDRKQTTVLDFNRPNRNGEHPTMKPIELFAYQIKNSTRPNDIVLDMFGGSGTTLMACEQLKRKCRIIEYDPKYATVIIDRWEQYTGKKAKKIKGNEL